MGLISTPPMPASFKRRNSRTSSVESTLSPFHHQRTKGRYSEAGCWNSAYSCSGDKASSCFGPHWQKMRAKPRKSKVFFIQIMGFSPFDGTKLQIFQKKFHFRLRVNPILIVLIMSRQQKTRLLCIRMRNLCITKSLSPCLLALVLLAFLQTEIN